MPFLEEKHVQLLRSSGLVGKVQLSTDMSQDDYKLWPQCHHIQGYRWVCRSKGNTTFFVRQSLDT